MPKKNKVSEVFAQHVGTGDRYRMDADVRSVALPQLAAHDKVAHLRPDGWMEFIGIDHEEYETADLVYEPVGYWEVGDFVLVYHAKGGAKGEVFAPMRIIEKR